MTNPYRVAIPLVFFFIGLKQLAAQDLLVLRDSSRMNVSITEVGLERISYKDPENELSIRSKEIKSLAYILFRNGQVRDYRQVVYTDDNTTEFRNTFFTKADSALYFARDKSIGLNLLGIINNEISLIYRQDFLKKHLSILVPFAMGYSLPWVTLQLNKDRNVHYEMRRKVLETGFGVHYIRRYRSNVNIFFGPDLRCSFVAGTQFLLPGRSNPFVKKNSVLIRGSFLLTTGCILRTKKRWQYSAFLSVGVSADGVPFKIREPYSQQIIDPIKQPYAPTAQAGFQIAYCLDFKR